MSCMKHFLVCSLVLIGLDSFQLFAQNLSSDKSETKQLSNNKYEADIHSTDKRINDSRNIKDHQSFPNTWRLYYKGIHGNYAVFYDLNGMDVYFRFRYDKFDLDGLAKLDGIQAGIGYQVRGTLIGMFVYRESQSPMIESWKVRLQKDFTPEQIQNMDNILVYELNSVEKAMDVMEKQPLFQPTQLEQVIP